MVSRVQLKFSTGAAMRSLDLMVARTPLSRMRGLLGRPALGSGQGMFIKPCNMIHTLGMRYPIDVVFVGRDGMVLSVSEAVAPRRMRACLRASAVLELAAGEAARNAIAPGVQLPVGAL